MTATTPFVVEIRPGLPCRFVVRARGPNNVDGAPGELMPIGDYTAKMYFTDARQAILATITSVEELAVEPGGATGELHIDISPAHTAVVVRRGTCLITLTNKNNPDDIIPLLDVPTVVKAGVPSD